MFIVSEKPLITVEGRGTPYANSRTIVWTLKLMMRLYEVGNGRITLAETDIRDYKLEELRGYFGVVF